MRDVARSPQPDAPRQSRPDAATSQAAPADVLALQRRVGNAAVVRLLRQPALASQWHQIVGEPFVPGPGDSRPILPSDVQRASIGNCGFLAALMAVAEVCPAHLHSLIVRAGPHAYDVTLWDHADQYERLRFNYQLIYRSYLQQPRRRTTRLDDSFPTDAAVPTDRGPGGDELWVLLLERAYARMRVGTARSTRCAAAPL